MRDVAIVATAQSKQVRAAEGMNEVEMLMPVLTDVKSKIGITQRDIGFTCSGSSDYLAGQPFSFVMTLDGVGAWPPISESHVEMDGAWALYEAWVKLQIGEIDTALIYSYAKCSPGQIRNVLSRQLDPYYLGPLWPDSVGLAALQARAAIDAGVVTPEAMAEVAVRSRRAAAHNPNAQLQGSEDVEKLLADDLFVDPLRKHDCPPITDGAVAVILAADDRARELVDHPAWITGIDHRIEAHALGLRDLTDSASTRIAADKAGVANGSVDVAELHAPFTHQELILQRALGLTDDVDVNPSGGALAANTVMAAGLLRFAEAAERVMAGTADRVVAHATSGPCLQQNMVAVLAGTPRNGGK